MYIIQLVTESALGLHTCLRVRTLPSRDLSPGGGIARSRITHSAQIACDNLSEHLFIYNGIAV